MSVLNFRAKDASFRAGPLENVFFQCLFCGPLSKPPLLVYRNVRDQYSAFKSSYLWFYYRIVVISDLDELSNPKIVSQLIWETEQFSPFSPFVFVRFAEGCKKGTGAPFLSISLS